MHTPTLSTTASTKADKLWIWGLNVVAWGFWQLLDGSYHDSTFMQWVHLPAELIRQQSSTMVLGACRGSRWTAATNSLQSRTSHNPPFVKCSACTFTQSGIPTFERCEWGWAIASCRVAEICWILQARRRFSSCIQVSVFELDLTWLDLRNWLSKVTHTYNSRFTPFTDHQYPLLKKPASENISR